MHALLILSTTSCKCSSFEMSMPVSLTFLQYCNITQRQATTVRPFKVWVIWAIDFIKAFHKDALHQIHNHKLIKRWTIKFLKFISKIEFLFNIRVTDFNLCHLVITLWINICSKKVENEFTVLFLTLYSNKKNNYEHWLIILIYFLW